MARAVYTVQFLCQLVVATKPAFINGGAGATIVLRDLELLDNDTPPGTTLAINDTFSGNPVAQWVFGTNEYIHWEGRIASRVGTGFELTSSNETYVTATGYLLSAT